MESHLLPRHLGFTGSEWPLDEAQLRLIATAYAQEYTRRFLQVYGSELAASSTGLIPLIGRWLDQVPDFDTVWDCSFGKVRQAVLTRASPPSVVQTGVLLGLRLLASGMEGSFQAVYGEPVPAICGHFLLPKGERLDAAAKHGTMRLNIRAGGADTEVMLRRANGGWRSTTAESLMSYHSGSTRFVLLPPSAANLLDCGARSVWVDNPAELLGKCGEALALIERHAPAFLPWIARVHRSSAISSRCFEKRQRTRESRGGGDVVRMRPYSRCRNAGA